jgi:GntR family transcriptional regulator
MLLDPSAGRSLTEQLADMLRGQITSGERPPGSQLPSEREFERDYGVSRTVVRDALDELVLEGIVVKKKGHGSFVREQPPVRRVDSTSLVLDAEVLDVEHGPLPADVADWLGCAPGSQAVVRRSVQVLNGRPAVLSTGYYPLGLEPDAAMVWQPAVLSARMPTLRERRLLRLDPGVPVVRVVRVGCDPAGHPLHVAVDLYAADQHEFVLGT